MLAAEMDTTLDETFPAFTTGLPSRRVAETSSVWLRSTLMVRPVLDVVSVAIAVAAVGQFDAVAAAFAALVVVGLATDWARPVPLSGTAPDEVRAIAVRASLPVVALLPLDASTRLSWLAVAIAALVAVARASGYGLVRHARRRRRVVERVLLLGSGDQILALRERIWSDPSLGLEPVLGSSLSLVGDDVSSYDSAEEIDRCVREHGVRRVVVAGGSGYDAEILACVRATRSCFDLLYLPGPQQPTLGLPVVGDEVFAGHPAVRLSGGPNRLRARAAKRTLDIVGAMMLLIVLLPVLVAAAFAVRLGSRGPILFRQARVGRNGRHFDMLKFRSFPTDHVDVTQALPLDHCPLAVGRFLRRTSIDELPQLFNVLRGEMSLVGPRPERPHFAEPLSGKIPDYDARHRVAGGLTGLAQVNGFWGVSEIESRIRLDNHYIDTWSLWRDIGIILRTVPAVVVKSFS